MKPGCVINILFPALHARMADNKQHMYQLGSSIIVKHLYKVFTDLHNNIEKFGNTGHICLLVFIVDIIM